MQLVNIAENRVTVDLDWADVKYLTHIIRCARGRAWGSVAQDSTMAVSYAETAVAFLAAAGMASWAHTVDEEEYTRERFADVVQLTPADGRRWRERVAEVQRPVAEERRPPRRPPPAA